MQLKDTRAIFSTGNLICKLEDTSTIVSQTSSSPSRAALRDVPTLDKHFPVATIMGQLARDRGHRRRGAQAGCPAKVESCGGARGHVPRTDMLGSQQRGAASAQNRGWGSLRSTVRRARISALPLALSTPTTLLNKSSNNLVSQDATASGKTASTLVHHCYQIFLPTMVCSYGPTLRCPRAAQYR